MSFASPFMLLGMLLLCPLFWLHLKRRPRKIVSFPTLFILRKVLSRQQKRSKVREWLILSIRALMIIAFSVALARPALTVWRPGGIRSGLPLSQVILLDNSASMHQAIESSGPNAVTAFDRARQMALAELGRLRPQDSVGVILTGQPPRLVTGELTTDKEQVALKLAELNAGFAADATDMAILKAERLLAASSSAQKEILVITDLCGAPIKKDTLRNMHATLRIVGTSPSARSGANVAITRVEVAPAGGHEAREVSIRAEISNTGAARKKVDAELNIDGKPVARGLLTLAPRQSSVKEFHHRFDQKGIHFGYVKIQDDTFEADNIRYLATNVRRSISVLVINGDSRPGSYLDETFYLKKALETPLPGEVPIRSQVMTPDIARVTPFDEYDVVFLAGLATVSSGLGERLVRYVEGGGGLFITATKNQKLTHLDAVMPAEVAGTRTADRKKHFKIGATRISHPIFHTLRAESTGLETTQIDTHLILRPNPAVEREVLIQLKDGLPLLVERKIHNGTVLLLTTTVDRDWGDLPIRPGFLPLIQRSTRYLARSLEHREPRSIDVGRAIYLPVMEGMQKLIALGPNRQRTVFSANRLTGKTRIRFHNTGKPGAYHIWGEMPESGGLAELPSSAFVANIAPSESDLSVKMKESGEVSRNEKDMYTALEGKLPIWSHLLLAGLALILLESLVAGMGLRKSHRKRVLE